MAFCSIKEFEQYVNEEKGWTKAFENAVEKLEENGGGTLYVPAGEYQTCSIVLKSNITLHLEAGAVLHYYDDREKYDTILIPYIGKPMKMFTPLIYAENAENVAVTGSGTINGHGETWWMLKNELRANSLRRPHTICFNRCRNVRVEHVTLINSPAWTIHPFACENVLIQGVNIKNPYDSPNTDGINPNSSKNVRIVNCVIDVGDDCIAIKSGTEDSENPMPCENIIISSCHMVHGHGGIVIGSEMSGDVRNVVVSDCVFQDTDRGIRLKTRRKRGGVIEQVRVQNIIMDRVVCPFIINFYYCCGEKGKEKYVWDKSPYPVDNSTPEIRDISISHVSVYRAAAAAGFFYGLSEKAAENITLSDCTVSMDKEGTAGMPAMMTSMEPMKGKGFFLRNVKGVKLHRVTVKNCSGRPVDGDNTAEYELS
ncbi:glycoside hydrolase family 28 protein [Clostridium sp. MCC353]|uniref:glycoside hydrolase family 28 protein n=1 Tax=Clostridium sp. MCC353 TaxID=2592646 RepID=UPI001C018C5E|nr:glycoside hydrolase family 28 protein [Clostridium sp. MCC353]MBT9777511.1 glycoside hydrolase family 28 protein [Clostridium sp. MCC353]